jgi:hypothetical protein
MNDKQKPSPTQSASLYKVGTKKKGNDGNFWIVTENKNGVHRWILDSKPSKKASIEKETKKGSIKSPTKYYKIRFCEPYTNLDVEDISVDFKVTDELYEVLKKRPKYKLGDHGNAYIFGKTYPLNEYVLLGEHGNDGAQTGLVDITEATQKELDSITADENWHNIYEPYDYIWDNRDALKLARKKISERILFVGQTIGGDVGAALFGHYDKKKRLDGLIIDIYCLFENEEDEEDVED